MFEANFPCFVSTAWLVNRELGRRFILIKNTRVSSPDYNPQTLRTKEPEVDNIDMFHVCVELLWYSVKLLSLYVLFSSFASWNINLPENVRNSFQIEQKIENKTEEFHFGRNSILLNLLNILNTKKYKKKIPTTANTFCFTSYTSYSVLFSRYRIAILQSSSTSYQKPSTLEFSNI